MTEGKSKGGHGQAGHGRRERRSKVRLSDVHRLVDSVVEKHMPEAVENPKHREHPEGERRSSGPHHPHKK